MNLNQSRDEAILQKRAFYMHKRCGTILKQLYIFLATAELKDIHLLLYTLKQWILCPFSSWPNDFRGMGEFVCNEIKAGRGIDREMATLLEFLKPVPSDEEQEAIGEYEYEVQLGNYDDLVRNDIKYQVRMKELEESGKFRAHFDLLQALYDLDEMAGTSGVIRRTMLGERNFRPKDFRFDWSTKRIRFQNVFDGFCWHHELYGLEKKNGKWVPLLMKVTVNVTPHGTMIYVPKWMSFDLKRDLIIKAVTELHKSRGTLRQGPKISESRLDKQDLAKAVYLAEQKAKEKDYKGPKRFDFITGETGLPRGFDRRRIRELINQGAEVVAAENELEAIAAIASLPPAQDTAPDALELALRSFDGLSARDKDRFMKLRVV